MKAFINKNSVKQEIKQIFETFNGDLYFLTEKPDKEGFAFAYVRLYAMPQMAKWGEINLIYLKSSEAYGKTKIWEVKSLYWENINSYEKGLIQIEREKGF